MYVWSSNGDWIALLPEDVAVTFWLKKFCYKWFIGLDTDTERMKPSMEYHTDSANDSMVHGCYYMQKKQDTNKVYSNYGVYYSDF